MAITDTQTQVTWSAASSVTVSSATEVVSDAMTVDQSCVNLSLSISVDNQGTPASGDVATFRIQWTNGDILGDTGDDFDTSEHATYVAQLDTYSTNTPGEDPARKTIEVPKLGTSYKLGVTCPNAATRNMVVRARMNEQRAA